MAKTPMDVLTDEFGSGELALLALARLAQHGYKIIKHRVIYDGEFANTLALVRDENQARAALDLSEIQ